MKKCFICKIHKEYSEFNKHKSRKDGYQSCCRICDRIKAREYFYKNRDNLVYKRKEDKLKRVIRNRNYVFSYLENHPCIDCGISDIRVLEFDHVRGEKSNNIGDLVSHGYSLKTIEGEMQKCEVRCANCHRIKTSEQFNYHGYLAPIGRALV